MRIDQLLHERGIEVGADFHDDRAGETADPAIAIVEAHAVACERNSTTAKDITRESTWSWVPPGKL